MSFVHGFVKVAAEAEEKKERPSIRKDIGTGFLAGGALGGAAAAVPTGIIAHKALKAYKDHVTEGKPERFKTLLYKHLRKNMHASPGNARDLVRHSGKAPLVAAGLAGLAGGAIGSQMGSVAGLGIGSARRAHHAYVNRKKKDQE